MYMETENIPEIKLVEQGSKKILIAEKNQFKKTTIYEELNADVLKSYNLHQLKKKIQKYSNFLTKMNLNDNLYSNNPLNKIFKHLPIVADRRNQGMFIRHLDFRNPNLAPKILKKFRLFLTKLLENE